LAAGQSALSLPPLNTQPQNQAMSGILRTAASSGQPQRRLVQKTHVDFEVSPKEITDQRICRTVTVADRTQPPKQSEPYEFQFPNQLSTV
jgi:hypothetical protein